MGSSNVRFVLRHIRNVKPNRATHRRVPTGAVDPLVSGVGGAKLMRARCLTQGQTKHSSHIFTNAILHFSDRHSRLSLAATASTYS